MSGKVSPSEDMEQFRKVLTAARHIVAITGAGISAESGVPTFRGSGGLWRRYQAQGLATPEAFHSSPSLVWEFYHYRRELVLEKEPNLAHLALAEFETQLEQEGKGRKLTILTQNVDGLHLAAGSRNVAEIHGSLYKTQCISCGDITHNRDSPICEALRDRGSPDLERDLPEIPVDQLPRCKKPECKGLLRPYIVWFGESLHEAALSQAMQCINDCDLCLVVGTSSIVYPAAMWGPQLAHRGVPVAEFNLEETPCTQDFQYHFQGPCSKTVPEVLGTSK